MAPIDARNMMVMMRASGVRSLLGQREEAVHRSVGVPAGQGATIVDALIANGTRCPDLAAMRYRPEERRATRGWEIITWGEDLRAARQVASALSQVGVEPGQRVAILSDKRAEWHLADLGALANGSATVPIYPTSSSARITYILGHAAVRVCFVDSHPQLGKILEIRHQLPALEPVVLADGARRAADTFVISFDEFRVVGADGLADAAAAGDNRRPVRAEDVATIVYTSGTTGLPKGAMISHAN